MKKLKKKLIKQLQNSELNEYRGNFRANSVCDKLDYLVYSLQERIASFIYNSLK